MGENGIKGLKWANAITFLLMVGVNALANILPINGKGTGEISDSYFNLFAPAGITFAIWGVIYLWLAAFVIYQAAVSKGKTGTEQDIVKRIGWYFIISSLANTLWIFCWHYEIISLSLALMFIILFALIIANANIRKAQLSAKEKAFVLIPFSIYLGWICVATIANVTTFLVSINWDRFGLSDSIWTIIAIAAGTIIGSAAIIKNRDIPYGLVFLWAYAGILIKHTDAQPGGFAGQYQEVIIAVSVALGILLVSIILAAIKAGKKNRTVHSANSSI